MAVGRIALELARLWRLRTKRMAGVEDVIQRFLSLDDQIAIWIELVGFFPHLESSVT